MKILNSVVLNKSISKWSTENHNLRYKNNNNLEDKTIHPTEFLNSMPM